MEEKYEHVIEVAAMKLHVHYLGLRKKHKKSCCVSYKEFVSLPTGSGKSLCYWILPFTFDYLSEVDTFHVLYSCH